MMLDFLINIMKMIYILIEVKVSKESGDVVYNKECINILNKLKGKIKNKV